MAYFSDAQICNIALSNIQETRLRVSNLDTDTGHVADTLRRYYRLVRQNLLIAHTWNFAQKHQALSLLARPEGQEWSFIYDYPADALQLHAIHRDGMPVPFVVRQASGGGRGIYTNAEQAIGQYTADVTAPDQFPTYFVQVFTWSLAVYIAPVLSGDSRVHEVCLGMYQRTLTSGKTVDCNEGVTAPPPAAVWDQARQAG